MILFMVGSQESIIQEIRVFENSAIGREASVLAQIHKEEINISIYNRDISRLENEIDMLLGQKIELRKSGSVKEIVQELMNELHPDKYGLMLKDIETLLYHFEEISGSSEIKLLLASIEGNMCRRFHTDINDIRMLCTYSGPGTLWLTEDNIDYDALNNGGVNESIVKDESKIQQAETGSVLVLKGAIYPDSVSNPVVHRSPTIEESGERRLLLRIDTYASQNLWK